MSRSDIMAQLQEELPLLERQFGVVRLTLFGSAARDELTSESDVDLLVYFDGPATMDRYLSVKSHLEEVLGRTVDLVTSSAMKPRLLARIRDEMLDVA